MIIEFTSMNTSKTLLVSTAVVLALALVLAPLAISEDALAKKSNKAKQIIEQSQKSKQNSQVVSGGSSFLSGNNFNFQDQFNKGNNALGQIKQLILFFIVILFIDIVLKFNRYYQYKINRQSLFLILPNSILITIF